MTVVVRTDRRIVALPAPPAGASGPPGPPGSGSTIGVKDEGTLLSPTVARLNFTGAGVTASGSGADIDVTIPGGLSFVTPQQFGAVADGSTDDSASFVAAIAYLKSIAVNPVISEFKASPRLYIPAGHYYLGTTTLDITHTLAIEGEGGQGIGAGGGAATKLRWDANTTGIRVQSEHTSGASTYDASPHFSGAFTTLRQLYLHGGLGNDGLLTTAGLSEGEYHGIHAKGTVFLDNVQVEGFQGDGLYAHNTIGAHDATEGYTNISRAYNCIFRNCRNGRSMQGGDSNAWVFVGCSYLYNRACGVDDESFLGNTEIHPHTNGNGVTADNLGTSGFPAYVVSNGGNRYCPVQGQEAAASTTAPSGTADTSVWYYLGAGGAATGVPAWTSGISLRCAAPFRTNNTNARNVFLNPYEESNQGFSQFVYPTRIESGTHGIGSPKGTGVFTRGDLGFFTVDSFNVPTVGSMGAANGSLGLELLAGKVVRINNQQVVGARQTGTAANATDLATAITLVNDLKAKLAAHGLIS